ncbi:DNA polymerase [Maribacter phage Panino]
MKFIKILILFVSLNCFSQTYLHINGGVLESLRPDSPTSMNWGGMVTYQPDKLGVRVAFSNNTGLDHYFDTYTAGFTYMLHERENYKLMSFVGGNFNHNKWHYCDTYGAVVGLNNLFKLQKNIYASFDFDFSTYGGIRKTEVHSRTMVGIVLRFTPPRTKTLDSFNMERKDYVFDIEFYQNFFCVCFRSFPDGDERIVFEISERKDQRKELIDFLLQDINNVTGGNINGLRLIGFNNVGYDYPVLHMLIESPDISLLIWWKKVQREIFNERKGMVWDNQRHVYQIDLFKINHYDNMAKSASLKWLEFTKKWYKVQDLPIAPDQIIETDQMDLMIDYCWNDVDFTFELAHDCWNAVKFRESMSEVLGRNVMDYSDVKIGEYLNQKKYEELSGKSFREFRKSRTFRKNYKMEDIIPSCVEFQTSFMKEFLDDLRKRSFGNGDSDFKFDIVITGGEFNRIVEGGFKKKKDIEVEWQKLSTIITFAKGGLHSIDMPRIVNRKEGFTLMEKDVGSMYPRSIVVNEIYPQHLGIEWNMGISNAYDYRLDVLKPKLKTLKYGSEEWQKVEDEQQVYKLAMNGGGFGKLGSEYSWQFDPLAKYQVTMGCELMLLMLIEAFLIRGIDIISVNTDGVVVHYPKEKQETVDKIHQWWEEKTQFLLEDTHYNKLVFSSVNDYIAVIVDPKTDKVDKIKYKGDFEIDKDPHKNNSQRIVPIALSEYFTKGVKLTDIIGVLGYEYGEGKNVDIYDYCIGKKKTSSCQYWQVKNGKAELVPDKVIRYYVANSSDYLMKKYIKGKREGRYEKMNAGFNHVLFMDWFSAPDNDYNIDRNYYLNECRKTINAIESGTRILERGAYIQTSLF